MILEPVLKAEIIVPDESMGDIMGDINSPWTDKRQGVPGRGKQLIKAEVPASEMQKYLIELRSNGDGVTAMNFSVMISHHTKSWKS
ncbi:MAG: hypothetical protein MZV65_44995 [Chromatiales bacterium]|nr:hypothetical protein [Chromatiales bacterium]